MFQTLAVCRMIHRLLREGSIKQSKWISNISVEISYINCFGL